MERIGRYEIISELGRGAMGIVYKAHDPRIGRDVAIKTIRLADQGTPDETQALRDRLFREAQSAGRLSHPGIVTIYDIDEEGGLAYISMEFVEGRTLEMLMGEGRARDTAFLARFIEQTAAALDYAHASQIVHRDVKPANMMITPQGGVKVTDFGIARIASSKLTQTGTVMGTPSYMSPEQVRGEAVDGRSDQFSLAVIAYELLTGQKPFSGDNLTAVIFKIVSGDPVPLRQIDETVPSGLEEVVLRGLRKTSDDRFESCKAFADAFLAHCAGWSNASPATTSTTVTKPPNLPLEAPEMGETLPATAGKPAAETTELERTAPVMAASKPPLPPLTSHTMRAQAGIEEEEASVVEPPARRRRRWPWLAVPGAVLLGLGAGLVAKNPWLLDDPVGLVNLVAQDLTDSGSGQLQAGGGPISLSAPPLPVAANTPAGTSLETAGSASDPATLDAEGTPRAAESSDGDTSGTAGPETASPDTPAKTTPPKLAVPAPTLVKVDFSSQASNARIIVDRDSKLTCTAPCSLALPRGVHSAVASSAGFRPMQKSFRLGSDPQQLNFELVAIAGMALITSRPDEADVFVDGRKRDERTSSQLQLSPGYHVILVEKAGAGSTERSVLIEADQLQHFPFSLRPGDPVRGTMVVKTTPPGALIVLNGRDRRGTTPSELELPPGVYGLRLSLDGHQAVGREVKVSRQQTQTVEITLQPQN